MAKPPVNDTNSYATCSPQMDVDMAHLCKVEPSFKNVYRMRTYTLIFWLVLGSGVGFLAYKQNWVGAIAVGVFMLVCMAKGIKAVMRPFTIKKSMRLKYYHALTTPGIVIEAGPTVTVLCMANLAHTEGRDYYATKVQEFTSISPQTAQIDLRVPCVSMFTPGSRHHEDFHPTPISWATPRILDVQRVAAQIGEDEWRLLERARQTRSYSKDGSITMLKS